MRILFSVCLAFLSACLFNPLALADKCSDYKQSTGLDLNKAECYVLEQVERGKVAHFKDLDMEAQVEFSESDNREHAENMLQEMKFQERFTNIENRELRAAFLEGLLTGLSDDLMETNKVVDIRFARISLK